MGGFVHHHLKSYIQKSFGKSFFQRAMEKTLKSGVPLLFLLVHFVGLGGAVLGRQETSTKPWFTADEAPMNSPCH